MAESSGSKKDAITMEAMEAAARQAIAELCDIKPEEVNIDENGLIDYSAHDSSAVVFFWADAGNNEPASYSFRCSLLTEVEDKPLIYKLLNEINADILFGQVYYKDGEIVLYYRLIVAQPDPTPIMSILMYMRETADDYDDKLKLRLGGNRFLESEEDEVEV